MDFSHSVKRALPNFFTFGNMACGFYSVLQAHQGNYELAAWAIFVAAFCDMMDGIMARLTKTSSQFGVELDSLADVVSFGFAPAFLLYNVALHRFDTIGLIVSVCFLLAGGFRLARFNTELVGFSKDYFVGLPIPAAAITAASFVLFLQNTHIPESAMGVLPIVVTLVLGYLMTSRIKYEALPSVTPQSMRQKPIPFIFVFVSIVLTLVTSGSALFYIFSLFIIFGITRHVYTSIKRVSVPDKA